MTSLANDAALIDAWNRFKVARTILSGLPAVGPTAPGSNDTIAEREQLDIIEPAEIEIAQTVATTVRGVEIKLWFILSQNIDESERYVLSALREDESYFCNPADIEWRDQIILSALQTLRALQPAQSPA